MRSFIALQERTVHAGGWLDCVAWSQEHAKVNLPVRILAARPGERHARIVAEVATDGERLITAGRTVLLSKLRKLRNG